MIGYYGDYPTSHTAVCMVFDSFAAVSGASSATSNFASSDILIYKDGGTTQRTSANGITVSTSFDSQTGLQMVVIDLSDNTDAGFYAAGHEYQVGVADVTIDSQTVRFWLGCFSIERAGGILALLKATGSVKVDVAKWATGTVPTPGQTGVPIVDLKYILGTVLTETAGQIAAGFKKLFDVAAPVLTLLSVNQTGDGYARLGAPAGASVSADVAVVKVDTAAVKVQTDKLAFTIANQVDSNVIDWKGAAAPAMTGDAFARLGAPAGASVSADVAAVKAVLPAALVAGRIDASVGAVASGVIAAASFAANALDAGVRTAVGLASANLDTQLDALPTNAELATALGTADDAVLAQVALVKAKTDNLPSDPADASDVAAAFSTVNGTLGTIVGYIDTEVAAIKAKTDSLTFTVPGKIDADITHVNGTAVTGNGASGTEWGPA